MGHNDSAYLDQDTKDEGQLERGAELPTMQLPGCRSVGTEVSLSVPIHGQVMSDVMMSCFSARVSSP